MMETIILDLDGPLLEGRYRHYQCYSDILSERGLAPVPLEQYWEMKRNRVGRRELLALSDAAGLYDEFLSEWMAKIEQKEYLSLDRLQEHVLDVMQCWKESNTRLWMATMRNSPVNLDWQLNKLGIADFFEHVIVVGSKAGRSKSEPIKALLTVEQRAAAIWVGDTEVDIESARELGIRVCALTCGLRTKEYLTTLSPDMLEKDLYTLAQKGGMDAC